MIACFLAFLVLMNVFTTKPAPAQEEPDLRFAVFGDVHYRIPDFVSAHEVVEPAAHELHALEPRPAFILQTGDFFHSDRSTDHEAEAAFAFRHFTDTIGMPWFIAIGNHDERGPFEKRALPMLSPQVGRELHGSYYSFDRANCHFLVLDCMQPDFAAQLAWAEADLQAARANPKIDHIFAAGHYPLWFVARIGMTNEAFSKPFATLLAKYDVDAYLCGHTHNTSLSVRRIDGKPLTQIMGCATVEEGRLQRLAPFLRHFDPTASAGPVPLEAARAIFLSPEERATFWGYLEGSPTSYSVVTVRGHNVRVDWHVLGQGVVRSYAWDRPGEVVQAKAPAPAPVRQITDADLRSVQQAWCYLAHWTSAESAEVPIAVNGVPAGTCTLTKTGSAGASFWNTIEVPFSADATVALRRANTLRIGNPDKVEFGVVHVFLLVKLADGRIVKTDIHPTVFASFPMKDQESFFPAPERIRAVALGQDLDEITLSFDREELSPW